MTSVHADAKRRRMACGLAWAALSALVCTACGGSSPDADTDAMANQRSVAAPKTEPAMMSPAETTGTKTPADPLQAAPMQPATVDKSKPAPGGQSGSDSGGSTTCPEVWTALAADDATPWGPTVAELNAQASERLSTQGAVALFWQVGSWKATALTIEVEPDATGAQLGETPPGSQCTGSRVMQPARVHLRTDDGVLDQSFDAQLTAYGDDQTFSFLIQGALFGDALAGTALDQALVDRGGIDGFGGLDQYDEVDLQLSYEPPGDEHPISGALTLWLRDNASGDGTQLVDLANFNSTEPVPSPRKPIAPPTALAAECSGLTETLPLMPPIVAYEDRLAALSGTWILCGGDRAEPIALDLAGVVIAGDGSFVHVVQNADGSLQQRPGFAHQGSVQIDDAMMGTYLVRAVAIHEIVLETSAGLVQAGSSQIELSADRNSMRWVVESEADPSLELVFHRSDLPVSAAPASSYASGARAGAAACDGDERDLEDVRVTDWQDVIGGSWVWCSGGPSDDVGDTLELDALGTFRQLDPAGHAKSSGTYAVMPGNPPEVHYLQLTPDGGTPWVMFAMLAAQTPRKLVVLTDGDDGSFRIGVLSAAP